MDAYTSFARVYDTFMDNIPYEEWAVYLTGLLNEYGVNDGLVLDLGCGTGNMTELLAKEGYDMIGVDNAEEMLEIAMEKREKSGHDILYLLQDMREFELYGTVRAVVSVCDSVNYIDEEEDLTEVFRLVNNYLDPGGVFIFDFNTLYKYREILGDRTIAENREDCSFIWDNYYYEESSPDYEKVKAAQDAVAKINNIGAVVLNDSCKKKIDAARTAYNVLNAEQKTLVVYSQLKILTDAEAQYDKLKTTADNIAKQKAQQEALKKKYTPSKTSIKSIKKLKKNQAKLTWKKVKNATGYEVYQSMKKNSGYKKVKTITKNKTVTYKAGKLKKKKTYYFKIRTYRKAGGTTYYGNYSNVKKMKVK